MDNNAILYASWIKILYELPPQQRHNLMDALISFRVTGEMPDKSDPLLFAIVQSWVEQWIRDDEKYKEKCEKNRANASKRNQSQANASERKQTDANNNNIDKDNNKEKDKDKNNDNDNDNKNSSSVVSQCLYIDEKLLSIHPQLKDKFTLLDLSEDVSNNILYGKDCNLPFKSINPDNSKDDRIILHFRREYLNEKVKQIALYDFKKKQISLYRTLIEWVKKDIEKENKNDLLGIYDSEITQEYNEELEELPFD